MGCMESRNAMSRLADNEKNLFLFFSVSLSVLNQECKLNVHKRCTRNVANDCGLDKKKLASVLADLNINTEPQKMVQKFLSIRKTNNHFVF